MKIVGLTGPTGSGKGVVGNAFLTRGIPVLDTDAVYHEWIEKPSSCTEELVEAFGTEILASDGSIDRPKLAAIVFSGDEKEKENLDRLGNITHCYVLRSCRDWLKEQLFGGQKIVVIDAPLLIEAGLHRVCHHVIAVLAPKDVRLSRIIARDGITRDAALARISAQETDAFYKEHANYVFVNDKTLSDVDLFVENVIAEISVSQ